MAGAMSKLNFFHSSNKVTMQLIMIGPGGGVERDYHDQAVLGDRESL